MRRCLLLILITLTLQSCDKGKDVIPPTDWQLENLSGQVKSRTISRYKIGSDEVEVTVGTYSKEGYCLESVIRTFTSSDNKVNSISSQESITVYKEYIGNKREVNKLNKDRKYIFKGSMVWEAEDRYVHERTYLGYTPMYGTLVVKLNKDGKMASLKYKSHKEGEFSPHSNYNVVYSYGDKREPISYVFNDLSNSEKKEFNLVEIGYDYKGNVLKVECFDQSGELNNYKVYTYEYYE
ncbi:hypothetical protein ACF8C4_00515 [Myroides odoratimimus]|uniref:hypothetical protein n=1 Tax=Myroides TaxID=76831 RepID=UPI0003547685|nr:MULTISPECIES: hypothetical protein [Myroides]AJA67838.1 hypothetical protein MYRA21_0646 [Myroides sp. A21]EPH08356.1 hypothetical protein HMPREF9713_03312 [Myroides odoratimimus CCUG 12700]MDM1498350.1 hypothetical protein [Myroides odoratimimus]MDM1511511.1 hypothetical protein [Myroides odoratimimus]MDM1518553.1 hypothetical protein [Myroides odoratimimus]